MKKHTLVFAVLAANIVVWYACSKIEPAQVSMPVPKLPAVPYEYLTLTVNGEDVELRNVMKRPSYQRVTNTSVTLGRILFYDKLLSINNTVACGSCHQQEFAFSDQMALSTGFANKKTLRNSMSIQNVVLNGHMFWDSRAESPYDLSLKPVFNHIEMGIENDEMLVKKVSSAPYYAPLFEKAFPGKPISKDLIAQALSHFLNAMFSQHSRFDTEMQNGFKGFTAMEKMGRDLFFSSSTMCSECHAGSNFASSDININMLDIGKPGYMTEPRAGYYGDPRIRGTANIGLDKQTTDPGVNLGAFRIPSLRNVALTGPYMHDGRFATLADVLNHYSSGLQAHPGIDRKFVDGNGKVKYLNLSSIEKDALIAFLHTLTDQNLISNPKFSDPFKP